jgi:hypothetical protein
VYGKMNKFLSSIIITIIFIVILYLISSLMPDIKDIVVLLGYGFILYLLFYLYVIWLRKYCLEGDKGR